MLVRIIPEATVSWLTHAWLRHEYLELRLPGFPRKNYRRGAIPHIQWVLDKFSRTVSFYPEVADDFETFARQWIAGGGGAQGREFIKLALSADAVVYNAENSIYRNTIEGSHGLFLLWLAKTQLGRISCIINQTAHINGVRPIMRGMIQRLYPLLDLVTAREPFSLNRLRRLGIDNAELVPDPVFALEANQKQSNECDQWRQANGLSDKSYFCLSTSGLPASRPHGKWDGAVAELVKKLKKKSLQAVLVAKDGPCRFLQEVAYRTGSIYFGPEHHLGELVPLFKQASFLVTGHYHYGIWAAMAGCPFIPFTANNHKMQGLCQLLEMPRREPFDVTNLISCNSEIVGQAEAILRNRSVLSGQLLDKSRGFRAKADLNVVHLRKLMYPQEVENRKGTD